MTGPWYRLTGAAGFLTLISLYGIWPMFGFQTKVAVPHVAVQTVELKRLGLRPEVYNSASAHRRSKTSGTHGI